MNKHIKKLLSGAIATTVLASVFGCSSFSNQPVELTYYGTNPLAETTIFEDNAQNHVNEIYIESENVENEILRTGNLIEISSKLQNSLIVKRIDYCLKELLIDEMLYGNFYQYENYNIQTTNIVYANIEDELYLKFYFTASDANNQFEDSLTIKIQKEQKRLTSALNKYETNNNINTILDEIAICLNYEIISLHPEKEEYVMPEFGL